MLPESVRSRHSRITRSADKELVTPPAEEAPSFINLMDALKASVQQIKAPATKRPRKMAASAKAQ